MNSLSQLNTASAVLVSYTDLRASKVTFDRLTPTNQSSSFTTGGTSTVVAGINITSIVNPSVENVYFQVDVSATTGATVTWATLPSGYTVTNIGTGVYRISNIQTAADWTVIKNAVIHSPTNYNQTFAYTCYIGYESTKTVSWTTTVQITQRASLTSHFTQTTLGGYLFGITGIATESSRFSVYCRPQPWTKAQAAFASSSSLSALGGYLQQGISSLSTISTLTEVTNRIKPGVARVSSTSLITTVGSKLKRTTVSSSSTFSLTASVNNISYINGIDTLYYNGNIGTDIFNGVTIDSTDTTSTFSITLTCAGSGEFGTESTSSNPYTFTGTKSVIEGALNSIYFYPTVGYTSNTTLTFSLSKSGTLQETFTIKLLYNGPGASSATYIINYSGTWTPPLTAVKYFSLMDYALVGGGGGGAGPTSFFGSADGGGGGGAGGSVAYYTNQTFNLSPYSVTVGYGGSAGPDGGSAGGSTIFNGHTVLGGSGGVNSSTTGNGGSNGSYSGGNGIVYTASDISGNTAGACAGGGGAGAGGAGTNGTYDNTTPGHPGPPIPGNGGAAITNALGSFGGGGGGGSTVSGNGNIGYYAGSIQGTNGGGYGNGGQGNVWGSVNGSGVNTGKHATNGGTGTIIIKVHN